MVDDTGPHGFQVTARVLLRDLIQEQRKRDGVPLLTQAQIEIVLAAARPCWDEINADLAESAAILPTMDRPGGVRNCKRGLLHARAALLLRRLYDEVEKLK